MPNKDSKNNQLRQLLTFYEHYIALSYIKSIPKVKKFIGKPVNIHYTFIFKFLRGITLSLVSFGFL